MTRGRWLQVIGGLGLCVLLGCGAEDDGKVHLTVYTSIYREVVPFLDAALAEAHPDLKIEWHCQGSERIAAQLNGELAAGGTKADLVMTSDAFWYAELAEAGELLAYPESASLAGWPDAWKDDQSRFCIVRLPVMVIAYNHEELDPGEAPGSFADLRDGSWKGRLSIGNPLESGSNFTTVVALQQRYGWEFYEDLRRNEVLSAGGNGAVMNRMETGESPIGMVLLENLLRARENGDSPLSPVFPSDGAVPVPSPMAILADCDQPDAARRFYDFMLSDAGQRAVVKGWMYSPRAELDPPAGAPPLDQVLGEEESWTTGELSRIARERDAIKKRFADVVLR